MSRPLAPTPAHILAWIAEFLAAAGHPCDPRALEDESFHALGVDSALSVELTFALGEQLGVEIDPTLVYDSRTVQGFAEGVAALALPSGHPAHPYAL